jgi:hypothetical protein
MKVEGERLERWYATNLLPKLNSPEAILAFTHLRLYVFGVARQWERISGLSKAIWEIPFSSLTIDSAQGLRFTRLSEERELDIHFYLTSWNGVRKHFADFVEKDGDSEIRKVWEEVEPLPESARQARHFFEHLDEREMQGKGYQFSTDGNFRVSYFGKEAKAFTNKWVSLGNGEVDHLIRAFDRVVEIIQNASKEERLS